MCYKNNLKESLPLFVRIINGEMNHMWKNMLSSSEDTTTKTPNFLLMTNYHQSLLGDQYFHWLIDIFT